MVWTSTCLGTGIAIVQRARSAPRLVWMVVVLASYSAISACSFGPRGRDLDDLALEAGGHDWRAIRLVPAAAAVLVRFAVFFKPTAAARARRGRCRRARLTAGPGVIGCG